MLSRLLRRLQGHSTAGLPRALATDADAPSRPTAVAPEPADGPPAAASDDLARVFVRHLLDAAPDAPVSPGLSADVLDRLGALARHLDVARLPRLPAVVPQLLAAMRRDDADATSLANLLARDPTLAGDVVRVANSAHYARTAPVGSLVQAIGTIGLDGLRYVVLTTVMRPILRADPSNQAARTGDRLARHGEARTWLCAPLAFGTCDAGEAQLASVVASTGLAALIRMLPRPLLAQAAADDDFAPALLTLAGELSARAAAHWRFDEPVRAALAAFACGESGDSGLGRTLAGAERLAMLHVLGTDGIPVEAFESTTASDDRLLAVVRAATRAEAPVAA
ncbi:HDOD domain-containing protein [Lysobacter xanthus]